MLDQLRRGASSWIAKILMAVLVVSFGVWGIADVFRGNSETAIAEVGGVDIPLDRFQREYNRAVQQLGRQAGRQITSQQAAQIGIPQQILGRLVTETVMDGIGADLGLGVSQDTIVQQIRDDPSFKNAAGEFDADKMRQLLAANGLTEDEFVKSSRSLADRRQIADGLIGGFTAPTPLVEAVDKYQNQERSIRYLTVTPAMAETPAAPTDDELKTYFEANKARFRAPEYRAFTLLVADPSKIADPAAVSDDDARKAYDAASGRFGVPEKRQVEQIVFPDKASAEAAEAKLKSGTDVGAIITERGLKPEDARLGLVAKADLVDPQVADAAFSLPDGGAAVVDGRFGPVLVHVSEIQPHSRQPFEEVAPVLKKEMAQDRAENEMLALYDQIEDARASGSTLSEIAGRFKLEAITVDGVDREGKTADGKPADLPQKDALLAAVFNADQGIEADPVEFDRRGFLWFDISTVTPARDRTLDEVRPEVVAAWTADAAAKALVAKADSVADAIRGGETIDAAATALGATVESAGPFKRGAKDAKLGADAVAAAFGAGLNSVATAPAPDGGRIVLVVTEIKDPVFFAEGPEATQISEELSRAIGDGLLAEYVADREAAAGVSVNQPLLMRAIGLDRDAAGS